MRKQNTNSCFIVSFCRLERLTAADGTVGETRHVDVFVQKREGERNGSAQPPADSCTSWQSVIATLWKEYRRKKLFIIPRLWSFEDAIASPTRDSWNHTKLLHDFFFNFIFFLSYIFSKRYRIPLVSFNVLANNFLSEVHSHCTAQHLPRPCAPCYFSPQLTKSWISMLTSQTALKVAMSYR